MDPKIDFESLKGDVSIIQSCTAELLSVAGTLNVPSWRFPEMTSSQVNANKVLEKICYSEDKEKFTVARTLLLELTVDRYVYCCLVERSLCNTAVPLCRKSVNNSSVKKRFHPYYHCTCWSTPHCMWK